MPLAELHTPLLVAGFVTAAVVAVYLSFVSAPYGRHARAGWGPTVPASLGWLGMEAPAAVLPLVMVAFGERRDVVTFVLLALWELHYAHRAFVYPWTVRGGRLPVTVAAFGAAFNVFNGWLNFGWLTALGPARSLDWLLDPRFLVGAALFGVGFVVNRQSDAILRSLRAPGETGYKIPHGGLYRWVSCPNYLGEAITWAGWALATWSLPGLFFFLFTLANLLPRARSHHADYRRRFPDYPPERRAMVPYLV